MENLIEISFDEGIEEFEFESEILKACNAALKAKKIGIESEISLLFTSNEKIKSLNNSYREKDEVTDVLSFQQFNSIEEILLSPIEPVYIGDIVISIDRAKEQAEEFGHTLKREIIYLVVHSMFHLLGHDHMEDDEKSKMRSLEKAVLEELKIFKSN